MNAAIPNNSIILAKQRTLKIPNFRGLSGSRSSHVGQLIDPRGIDITTSNLDPFIVSLGRSFDPGTMYVRGFRSLRDTETGIYTYRTPDEKGKMVDINIGIYTSLSSKIKKKKVNRYLTTTYYDKFNS